MKKLAYLGVLAMGLSLAACSDYEEPHPEIPVTPPTSSMGISAQGVTLTPTASVGEGSDLKVIDMLGYTRMGMPISVATISTDPETYNQAYNNFTVTGQMSTTEDFASYVDLQGVSVVDDVITLDSEAFEATYKSFIGKNPAERTVYTRYAIVASGDGTGNIRLGGDDYWFGPIAMQILPVDEGIVIEQAYYLVGTVNGWSGQASQLIKFNHSDRDAFDDPVFYMTVEIDAATAAGGWWWKIIPASAIDEAADSFDWDQAWGVETDGDNSLTGTLVNSNAQSAQVDVAGIYSFQINMLDCTYEFKATFPYLYTPGGANGWSQTASQLLTTTDYETYFGFILADGEFKLSTQPNWDGVSYGNGGDGILSSDGGAGNLSASETGLNYVQANIAALTYEAPVLINSFSFIGDFNSWGGDVDLTPSDDKLTWTGTLTLPAAGGFKIRCNHDWAISLGNLDGSADMAELTTINGNNITMNAGTYEITLHLGGAKIYADVVAK